MIRWLTDNILKFSNKGLFSSNFYYIKDLNLLIDTGFSLDREKIIKEFGKVVDFSKIDKVIFTHLHFDHIGNYDLYPNAKFYAHKEEINSFKKNKILTILDPFLAEKFNININDVSKLSLPKNYEIIHTPGHTIGSICIYDNKNHILFTGDTLFFTRKGKAGLPTSKPGAFPNSLKKLSKLKYLAVCPGHDI